jgi:4-methylaminobutanoate oxidase (formaldehyde-forming)
VYETHYPGRAMKTARNAKLSPIHQRLVERGAYFKDVSGWESPDYYGPAPSGLTWGKPAFFDLWAAEHRACREGVILMDMSFMSKFLVQGRDAGSYLDYLSANRVDGAIGEITYTQWLNPLGKLEADLTVTKLAEDRFWVVASDTAHGHAHQLLLRHIGDRHVFVTDVTGGYAQINVQGPLSRDLLKTVTSSNLDTLPYRGAREIDLGFARVLCIRITYLGELGYELYIAAEQAVPVYDLLVQAGEPFGLKHAGLKALSSLRMEKAYRDYGHDIDNTDSVLEAGLGFAVALDKPDFIGRDAVLAKKAEGPLRKRLIQVLVRDPKPMMFHAEVVRRNGIPLGYVRAASYGHTLGGAVGLAMIESDEPIDQAYVDSGDWSVDIAGTLYPATVSLRPLYDPKNERIKL